MLNLALSLPDHLRPGPMVMEGPSPTLPEGMSKTQALDIISRALRLMGLSARAVLAFRVIAQPTQAKDWTEADQDLSLIHI